MIKEEELFIKIIFKDESLNKKEVESIDLEKLVIFSSSHLMLPCLYYNIKAKGYLSLFPKDFIDYTKNIYEINKNRNIRGITEINELKKIMDKANIQFILLKGAASLVNNYYSDLGERMIFDIDFLIREEDKERTEEILSKNNYFETDSILFFEKKHLQKRVKKNYLFGIEPHIKLLNKKNNFIKINFDSKNNFNKNKLDENSFLKHSIYNYQINDNGYYNFNYSYRSIYDTLKIIEKNKFKKLKIKNTKELIRYFDIIGELKIFDSKKIGVKSNNYNIIIFNLIRRFKFLRKTNILLNNLFLKVDKIPSQLKLFIKNKEYRNYLANKPIKKN